MILLCLKRAVYHLSDHAVRTGGYRDGNKYSSGDTKYIETVDLRRCHLVNCQYYIDVVDEIMNMECWSNVTDREHQNTLIKPCPSTTLCTTNPGTGLGLNPSFCGEGLTTNRRPMLVGV
jgi:hypothetical protein